VNFYECSTIRMIRNKTQKKKVDLQPLGHFLSVGHGKRRYNTLSYCLPPEGGFRSEFIVGKNKESRSVSSCTKRTCRTYYYFSWYTKTSLPTLEAAIIRIIRRQRDSILSLKPFFAKHTSFFKRNILLHHHRV